MALALNNLKRVDMPLNKETETVIATSKITIMALMSILSEEQNVLASAILVIDHSVPTIKYEVESKSNVFFFYSPQWDPNY